MKSRQNLKRAQTVEAPKVWTVLAKCHHAVAVFAERSVVAEGLCLSDFMVLEALLHKGSLTISAIAEKVLLASASMTSAIDRLGERGLVTRSDSKEDRRVRLISLTAKGKKLITSMYSSHARHLEDIMKDLSSTERKQLQTLLKKLGCAAKEALNDMDKLR
jgi:MarR family 2-MHQ and catechol resistance regulon transcriptional repressor